MAGKLFQEYIVDSWATTEQSRLNWIKLNQSTIRADTYQGLTDAVTADPNTWISWSNSGTCLDHRISKVWTSSHSHDHIPAF